MASKFSSNQISFRNLSGNVTVKKFLRSDTRYVQFQLEMLCAAMVPSFPLMASTQPSATAAWRRWRFRGIVLLLVLPVIAAYALVTAGNARADGSGPSPDPSADALAAAGGQVAPAPSQAQASTDQAAEAAAGTAQQARNVVVSIRIDSPGDDGDIAQANTAASNADAANAASTAQGNGPGGDVASSLEAAAQQAANAVASSTQQAQNIVISIRINSPGNNGAIGQTNSSTATANAGNTASTRQGLPAEAAADASAAADGTYGSGAAAAPQASTGPAATAASGPKTVLPRLIATRPSLSAPVGAPAIRPAAHRRGGQSAAARPDDNAPASGAVSSGERHSVSAPRDVASAPSAAAPSRTRTVLSPSAAKPVSTHSVSAPAPAPKQNSGPKGIRHQAASWLSSLGHKATVQQEKGQSISQPVLLTLIALLIALPVLLCSTYAPGRLRGLSTREWIHR